MFGFGIIIIRDEGIGDGGHPEKSKAGAYQHQVLILADQSEAILMLVQHRYLRQQDRDQEKGSEPQKLVDLQAVKLI